MVIKQPPPSLHATNATPIRGKLKSEEVGRESTFAHKVGAQELLCVGIFQGPLPDERRHAIIQGAPTLGCEVDVAHYLSETQRNYLIPPCKYQQPFSSPSHGFMWCEMDDSSIHSIYHEIKATGFSRLRREINRFSHWGTLRCAHLQMGGPPPKMVGFLVVPLKTKCLNKTQSQMYLT